MMRFNRKKNNNGLIAYTNFTWVIAKVMLVLFLVTLSLIAIKTISEGIKPPAEYTIEIRWDDGADADVDTWLRTPSGEDVWYSKKEVGLVTLERDDTGLNDTITENGHQVKTDLREEITSIRGVPAGQYTLNVFLYRVGSTYLPSESDDPGRPLIRPLHVHITIQKMNPSTTIKFDTTLEFVETDQELHVTRFTIEPDGTIDGFTDAAPISIVKDHYPDHFIVPNGASP